MNRLAPYKKTVTAVVGAALAFAGAVIVSDPAPITASEWLMGAVGLATALGVYGVTNTETV